MEGTRGTSEAVEAPDAVEREYAYMIARAAAAEALQGPRYDGPSVEDLQKRLQTYRAQYKNCEAHK